MVNIQDLLDDAKCYQTIRVMRWPDGVTCPRCSSDSVIKNGRDDTQPDRQRYVCKGCRQRFDDLTDPIFAGHHQPLRTWIACLYLMGLNQSGLQIAQELDINKDDARAMIGQLRQGIVDRRPPVVLEGEVECDEVSVVAAPATGIPQESLPLYLGFFEFVPNVRARGKRLLGSLMGLLLTPPCNPS